MIHVFVSRSNANIFVIGWQQHLSKKQKYLFLVYTAHVEFHGGGKRVKVKHLKNQLLIYIVDNRETLVNDLDVYLNKTKKSLQ